MLPIVLFVSVVAAVAAFDGRIVGGIDAKAGEFPFIVSVQQNGGHFCGGSIINEKYVISAAHCYFNHQDLSYTVVYGAVELSTATNVANVEKVTLHENYEHSNKYPNDIAMLQLTDALLFGPFVQPIAVPDPDLEIPDYTVSILAGWGYTRTGGKPEDHLKKVKIAVFPDSYCSSHETWFDPNYHICAGVPGGGKGQCSGDSGGPLVIEGIQVGVVSWSVKPCANPMHPGIFTKLTNYAEWIAEHSQLD